jgi:hypothetical protein
MNDLLNLAMKAHGGLERWKQVRNMQAKVTLNGRGRRVAQPGSAPDNFRVTRDASTEVAVRKSVL